MRILAVLGEGGHAREMVRLQVGENDRLRVMTDARHGVLFGLRMQAARFRPQDDRPTGGGG